MVRFWAVVVGLALAVGCGACTTSHSTTAHQTRAHPITASPTTTLPVDPDRVAPTRTSAPLTLSSTSLRVGQPVTITGADCTPGHWGWATIDESHSSATPAIFARGDFGLYDDEFFIASDGDLAGGTVGASGRWSMTALVPMVAPGAAHIVASCTPHQGDDASLTDFFYRPISVKVTSPYSLAVRPGLTVAPGATVSISPIGGGCGAADYAYVALYATAPKVTQVVQGVGTVTGGTGWEDTLTVPRGLAPGHYRLEADCAYSRGAVLGSYPAVSLNVT